MQDGAAGPQARALLERRTTRRMRGRPGEVLRQVAAVDGWRPSKARPLRCAGREASHIKYRSDGSRPAHLSLLSTSVLPAEFRAEREKLYSGTGGDQGEARAGTAAILRDAPACAGAPQEEEFFVSPHSPFPIPHSPFPIPHSPLPLLWNASRRIKRRRRRASKSIARRSALPVRRIIASSRHTNSRILKGTRR